MNNEKRLNDIAFMLYKKPWVSLTEEQQKDVIQNWEHPFWARNDRLVDALKNGQKIVL